MAFEAVRGYLQLASGLGEMTKAKALETAQGLLALPAEEVVGEPCRPPRWLTSSSKRPGPTASISLRSCEAR